MPIAPAGSSAYPIGCGTYVGVGSSSAGWSVAGAASVTLSGWGDCSSSILRGGSTSTPNGRLNQKNLTDANGDTVEDANICGLEAQFATTTDLATILRADAQLAKDFGGVTSYYVAVEPNCVFQPVSVTNYVRRTRG